MSKRITTYLLQRKMLLSCAVLAASLAESRAVAMQQPVSVVDLSPVSAKSTPSFGSILNVIELADGQLAVNDASSRQLIYLDRTLTKPRVVLDSSMSSSSYGVGSRALIMCNCNEVWFPDFVSKSILTYDQTGNQKRVMAAPNASDFSLMTSSRTLGDSIGHLFYRGRAPRPPFGRTQPAADRAAGSPDSTPLLRANFETRKVDTIATLRALRSWMMYYGSSTSAEVRAPSHIAVDILASIDEWTALPDGTVAIVRGYDYHIDWLLPNGSVVKSPKLPFDFKRLTDADKKALMDSARTAELNKHRAEYEASVAAGSPRIVEMARAASSSSGDIMLRAPTPITTKTYEYVQPVVDDVPFDRIPDYYPPIRSGAVTSDLDGNVWILPTTSAQPRSGELVYDVVNRARGLIMRARIPAGRSIAGFGKNGTVYLMSRDASGKWLIERSALPRKL